MRGVRVDPAARTVRAAGGATWGDVDRETQLFGLAAPGGVVSTTGDRRADAARWLRPLAPQVRPQHRQAALGGDRHRRRPGPHGQRDRASPSCSGRCAAPAATSASSPRSSSAPSGRSRWSSSARLSTRSRRVRGAAAWRDFMATAPEEINSLAVLWSVPDDEHFPAELWRRPVVILAAVYAGPRGGRAAPATIARAGHAADGSERSDAVPALQAAFDPFFPKGRLYYWKSTYVDDLSDAGIDTMIEPRRTRPSNMSDIHDLASRRGHGPRRRRTPRPTAGATRRTWSRPRRHGTTRRENDANIAWARDAGRRDAGVLPWWPVSELPRLRRGEGGDVARLLRRTTSGSSRSKRSTTPATSSG